MDKKAGYFEEFKERWRESSRRSNEVRRELAGELSDDEIRNIAISLDLTNLKTETPRNGEAWALFFRLSGAVPDGPNVPRLDHPPLQTDSNDASQMSEPSIRLLKFQLSPVSGKPFKMAFDLEVFSLSSCPPYKALSYTWGSPFLVGPLFDWFKELEYTDYSGRQQRDRDWESFSYAINCNNSKFMVKLNLYEALRRLLLDDERGWLWIDAICINQSDVAEKESQVAMMAEIYQRAQTVVVWMGPYQEDTRNTIKHLDFMSPVLQQYDAETKLFGERKVDMHESGIDAYLNDGRLRTRDKSKADWFSLYQLCRRSWFWRRWTLQEMALARHVEVYCGPIQLDWPKLGFLTLYLERTYFDHFHAGPNHFDSWFTGLIPTVAFLPSEFCAFHMSTGSDRSLLETVYCRTHGVLNSGSMLTELLYRTRNLQCAEPRDIYFGLRSILQLLVQEDPEGVFRVDYGVQIETLFHRMVEGILTTVPSLGVLSLKQNSKAVLPHGIYRTVLHCSKAFSVRLVDWSLSASPDLDKYHWLPLAWTQPIFSWTRIREFAKIRRRDRGLIRRSRLDLDLPSWVPDLWANSHMRNITPSLGLDRPFKREPVYNAAFASTNVPYRRIEGSTLCLNGHYIGTIDLCVDATLALDTNATFVRYLEACSHLPLKTRGGLKRLETFWRLLVLDVELHNNMLHPASPSLGLCLSDWIFGELIGMRASGRKACKSAERCCTLISSMPDVADQFQLLFSDSNEAWYQKLRAINEHTSKKDLEKLYSWQKATILEREMENNKAMPIFNTIEGDLGQGSFQQRAGDQVWVLENGRVPFLLRPCSDPTNFTLVQECYLHGIMNGELLRSGSLEYKPVKLV